MQKETQNSLYRIIENYIPKQVLSTKNRAKTWLYGYNEKYDVVIISKTGQIETVIEINGLKIALPKTPKEIYKRSKKKEEQYWEPTEISKELHRIKSIFQWHETPDVFKGNGETI